MNIFLLGAAAKGLIPTLEKYGDEPDPIHPPEWIISFGHRRIIPKETIDAFPNRIINIHISVLPWNRGADPNFWSWFEETPKGVTIHQITKGTDTGPILAQSILPLKNDHTLRTSYDVLMNEGLGLFARSWGYIRDGQQAKPQGKKGSYHRQADKAEWMAKLPLGLDTPCREVERLGRHILTLADT